MLNQRSMVRHKVVVGMKGYWWMVSVAKFLCQVQRLVILERITLFLLKRYVFF